MTMEWECRGIKMSEKEKFAYNTQETQSMKELRQQLNEILGKLINQDFTNKETGLVASISQREINKMSEQKAVNKSLDNGFTKEEHFEVAKDIAPLYENATLKAIHEDSKKRINVPNIYRFAIDISVNGKDTNAKITAFEKIEGKNRIYTIELLGLNPLPNDSRVLESEVAKSLNSDATAHIEASTIANFDNESIAQSKQQSQAKTNKKSKSKSKSKQNDFENQM